MWGTSGLIWAQQIPAMKTWRKNTAAGDGDKSPVYWRQSDGELQKGKQKYHQDQRVGNIQIKKKKQK